MVDFRKKLGKSEIKLKIDPIEIYNSLDWRSDKSNLRPAQVDILKKWFQDNKDNKDIIIKLHTGQGKTLIGLLILQSYLNENKEPVIYLCPDNYLLKQTCKQADIFGISYCTIDDYIPEEFIDGKKILITTCSKLFNGRSKFGIDNQFIKVNAILMDDAHQCMDYIKNTFKITLNNDHKGYSELLSLFGDDIKSQGMGTYQEIINKDFNAYLPVPYWSWIDKFESISRILVKYKEDSQLLFSWPLIKNDLINCECIISGEKLEIYPSISLINKFGTYSNANHRIFMSATIVDDSYLIKGLGVDSNSIKNPIIYDKEKWSGERMILIPSMIDESLNREEIIFKLSKINNKKSGVVVLAPSYKKAKDWENNGVKIATRDDIYDKIELLKKDEEKEKLVIVNRYDGIDLPDSACRLLIMDSKPVCDSLEDKYIEDCLDESEIIKMKISQTIEQGLGRSVRGPKDFSVIVLTGSDLVSFIRSSKNREYLSSQTKMQVKIGIDTAEYAVEDIKENGTDSYKAFIGLINQSLRRDEGWKEYYKTEMDSIKLEKSKSLIDVYELEYLADMDFKKFKYEEACKKLQKIIDKYYSNNSQIKGWYLQKMSKYKYLESKLDSIKLQKSAYNNNNYLLKPNEFIKPTNYKNIVNLKRVTNIINILKDYENHEELILEFLEKKTKLSFNSNSDEFEKALDYFGKILGFNCNRPDKEFKEGPDNLWQVSQDRYFLIECKNQVDPDRSEISRSEVGQLNTSIAWFNKNYGNAKHNTFMIISTNKLSKGSVFSEDVKIINITKLNKFIEQIRKFIIELKKYDLKNITEDKISKLLIEFKLGYEDIIESYSINTK
ncbi:DEAD/DEAH box helicase family protein [Clostridium tertium]|uniref:DEAD/DEAH box helicase family protein n=1 Tax=Clostridium tertium TaxID=1559 RepID=UPI001C1E7AAA|nr:DEAD/DEAH box helicase family protein [Clostridium tertium]MBU6134019.1 DEAD/DEAH box helicase family protein [Clostridium tertium]